MSSKTTNLNFVRRNIIDNMKFSYIDKSEIHGFGLFANQDIDVGTVLGMLDGQEMTWDKYDELESSIKLGKYQNYIFMEWNALSATTLLVRAFRTKYSYINHSKNPNVQVMHKPLRIEVIKKIKIGEEILIDYTKEPLRDSYLQKKGKEFL